MYSWLNSNLDIRYVFGGICIHLHLFCKRISANQHDHRNIRTTWGCWTPTAPHYQRRTYENRNTSPRRNHKTWKLTRITTPPPQKKKLPPFQIQRLSRWVSCLPNGLRIWEHFYPQLKRIGSIFHALEVPILKPQCWKVIFLFSEDTVDGSEIPNKHLGCIKPRK